MCHPPKLRTPYGRLASWGVGVALLTLGACGGDDEGSSNEKVTEDIAGCYDPEAHVCDCETDESSCEEAEGVWTDQCACE